MSLPSIVQDAVLVASTPMTGDKIKGYDFNEGIDFSALLASYKFTGFQASNLALAIEEINRMVPLLSLLCPPSPPAPSSSSSPPSPP